MKFTLALLLILALTIPGFCQWEFDPDPIYFKRSANFEDIGSSVQSFTNRNSLQSHSNRINLPFKLPDFISKWIPDLQNVLLLTKNAVAGAPARIISSSINTLCNIASYAGFLKPSYVPPKERLSLDLYAANKVVQYPLGNVANLLNDPSFNSQQNVTFYISSWETVDGEPNNVINILSQAYLARGSYNFILIEVGEFVGNVYEWAVLDSKKTGQIIGDALVQLINKIPAENVHLIGHGLGAHIAGIAGRYVQQVTGKQIARITALDPSRICHDEQYGSHSLQRGDAAFIDVIHSNSGVLGKSEPVGDADFYPNGPIALPPGCTDVICAHNLAVRYYAESVNAGSENNFMAVRCSSLSDMQNGQCQSAKIPMGLSTPSHARGSYYLVTNSNPPFGKDAAHNNQSN